MRTIWKFVLSVSKSQRVKMPRGALVLHVADQRGDVCMWVEVDSKAPRVERIFGVFGTGWELAKGWVHHGTALCEQGSLVWHVYENLMPEASS